MPSNYFESDTTLVPLVFSFFLSSSIPEVLCDPINLILKEETPFEAMTGLTAFIDGLLAEVFRGFPHL